MKIRRIAVILLIAVMALSLSACNSNKNEINSLMTEFERACNGVDINTMLDCIDPAISDKVKLATGLAGMFSDKDSDEITGELVGMLTGDNSLNAEEFFSSVKIEISDIEVEDQYATADAVVEYKIAGEEFKKDAGFEYVYKMEKWYISGFDLK